MQFTLFKFTLVLNSVRLFKKLLVFLSLLGTSDTSLCSMFGLQVNTVPPLDALQLLMLSARTLISFEDKMSPLNIYYYKLTVCVLSVYLIALCT
jgi:hypothetical protein